MMECRCTDINPYKCKFCDPNKKTIVSIVDCNGNRLGLDELEVLNFDEKNIKVRVHNCSPFSDKELLLINELICDRVEYGDSVPVVRSLLAISDKIDKLTGRNRDK